MVLSMLLLVPVALASWPEPPSTGWATVQDAPLIACVQDADGRPWCYAEADAQVAFSRVVAVIRDLDHYPDTFDHVDQVRRVDANTAWIHIDYPSPLTDRDYVARFTQVDDAAVTAPAGSVGGFHIRFHAAESADAPPTASAVRLPHAAGGYDAWDLGNGRTRIRYTWETEIGGDLPTWVSERARTTHGSEVIDGIVKNAGG